MLIRDAEINFNFAAARRVDMRIERDRIAAVAAAGTLTPYAGEEMLDAAGNALLPGLHDHHLHLVSLAVALDSLHCGPPQVTTAEELAARLAECAAQSGDDEWLRGIGYHESVAGDIDRDWLDRIVSQRPVRIQHRSGRLWIVNSRALERLLADGTLPPAGMEQRADRPTGRIYDADAWLRERLPRAFPSLDRVGALLASQGVTGVTDATPHNDRAQFERFVAAHAAGDLAQDILLMGDASLDGMADAAGVRRGPLKIHLHENELPPFDSMVAAIARSHAAGRPVAIHCVTVAELVFSLGALECAGSHPGDRIEHAAVTPSDVLPLLAARGVAVVTQPNFVFERGDAYRRDVPVVEQPWLYRLRSFIDAGIPLAGGTDAPFGGANPWAAMQAAVDRRNRGGDTLGAAEALTPEQALALFLGAPENPGGAARSIAPGAAADLCLLDRSWKEARRTLGGVRVLVAFKDGQSVFAGAGGMKTKIAI